MESIRRSGAQAPQPGGIEGRAGIGLRAPHVAEVLADGVAAGFLEIHAENYLCGGPARRAVEQLRRDHAVSVHAVGLSLGTAEGLDETHVARVRALVERLEPALVSDHLSWSVTGGAYLNDLLPLPFTEEALDTVCRNVGRLQDALRRRILVENPSAYLRFAASGMPEPEFLAELARRSGCLLLFDVNNVFVTARNMGFDPQDWIGRMPPDAIGQYHLAGHAVNDADGETILIDDHGSRVCEEVWTLFGAAVRRFGPRPTLVEWDTDIPALAVLVEEARRADSIAAAALAAGRGEARHAR